jgi:5-methylcytosine-specific restriction endonuclease McrA
MFNSNVKEWVSICKIVFKRDGYICQYCGKIGGKLECDHIIPFSAGGSDELENLTTSCQKCNRQKKDKTVEDFRRWILATSNPK